MGKNVYAKFSLENTAESCQDGSMCNPIPRVVGNPNRTVHSTGLLKALTTSSVSSVCISANGITRGFVVKLKCKHIVRTIIYAAII